MTADHKQLAALREPFGENVVGLLPKLTCPDCSKKTCQRHQKQKCQACDAYISTAHIHLDYVGHAAVTDRLLTVDPEWTWEPLALDAQGLPALDREGNLWIRLTVCGVTRLGAGDGPDMKVRIGDVLRNAAMRFGVALSLWTKDELESGAHEQKATEPPPDPNLAVAVPQVTSAEAKMRLLSAFDGDKKKAQEVWGDRGHDPITEDALTALIASAASRPFTHETEGAST